MDTEPVLDIENQQITERQLSPLLEDYKTGVMAILPQTLQDIRILGSFGTGNEQQRSDLDAWLVIKLLPNLKELSVLSQQELAFRKRLSNKYGYPNLARHRATIFSTEQTDIYERSFALRVGIPHNVGANASLIDKGSYNPESILHPSDLATALIEYHGLYDRNEVRGRPLPPRKYIRRMVQDMTLFFQKEYITEREALDEIIRVEFGDSDTAVVDKSKRTVADISGDIGVDKIHARELSHICLFAMEKVAWAHCSSYLSKRAFDEWRFQRTRHASFYPVEIRELVAKFETAFNDPLPSNKLLDTLGALEKPQAGLDEMENYYQVNCAWMLKAGNIALKASV